MSITTEWRTVAEDARYQVSFTGEVRGPSGRTLRPSRNRAGYLRVNLGEGNTRHVHRLVAEAFVGPVVGLEVDHLDGDVTNNRASNLQVITRAQHLAVSIQRRPNCKRGHPLVARWGRRYCPTCTSWRESRRVR